jgi:DNA topoisomerase I
VAGTPSPAEGEAFARRLGLTYTSFDRPGIRRVRRGRGWSFTGPDGARVEGVDRDRCLALAIPPAWQEVWICPTADGHLQASGFDEAGRRQYRYHARWTEGRSAANFDRLEHMGPRLPRLRRTVDRLLLDDTDPVTRATAAMVRLVDAGMARIGGTRSASETGHYGVSTLKVEHVAVDGDQVHLAYPGKSGVEQDIEVEDPLVADVLVDLEDGSERLFDVVHHDHVHRLSAADANALLARLTAGAMTCKDFRTWGGSAVALEARIEGATDVEAVDAAAERLGNTRAVARSSYIHPDVLGAPIEELHAAWRGSRGSLRLDRRERALARLLHGRPSLLERWLADQPPADAPVS